MMAPSRWPAIKLLMLLSAAVLPSHAQQCLPPLQPDYTYLGCWNDNNGPRDLTGAFLMLKNLNSVDACASICGNGGYKFFGVEFTDQCFCGVRVEDIAFKQPEESCNIPCPANSSQICGGSNRISLYQLNNELGTVLSNPLVPNCQRDPLCSNDVCNKALPIADRARALVELMTLDEKIQNLDSTSPGAPRLGIEFYQYQGEALHGIAGSPGVNFQSPFGVNFSSGTAFPVPLNMAAAFDTPLITLIGNIISIEARAFFNRAYAGLTYFTPNVNPYRDPRWGRGQETPGEDPFVISEYLTAMVSALQDTQGTDYFRVAATCKHYAAYDVENGRTSNNVVPSLQDMADYYLVPFDACAAVSAMVMCSYNSVNGIPACANEYFLQEVLRDTFGFNESYNAVVADCDAIAVEVAPMKWAANGAIASGASLTAGTDLDCGTEYGGNLQAAIQQNLTTEAAVDTSLTRLIALLLKVGLFDLPEEFASYDWVDVNTTSSRQTAYQIAAEGLVLLKNDHRLPFRKEKPGKIALIGPSANDTADILGDYAGQPSVVFSLLDVFQENLGDNVQYALGAVANSDDTSGFAEALAIGAEADQIIFCGGINLKIENEGFDRPNITWPQNQLELILQLAALGKPVTVVQFGAGQVDDAELLAEHGVGAILWAGSPGQEGPRAIFDAIMGDVAPAGRLPVTQYPGHYVDNFSSLDMALRPGASNPGRTYKWYDNATLPFGHGLHYTSFNVSPVKSLPDSDISSLAGSVTVSIKVDNVGSVESDYVALLFVASGSGPAPAPIKSLISFARAKGIGPGQSQQVDLVMDTKWLARADENGAKWIYAGDYQLKVDVGDAEVALGSFTLTGADKKISSLPPLQT